MKKILENDKKRRVLIKSFEKQRVVLHSVFKNSNLMFLIRWNAFLKLKLVNQSNSKISITSKCLKTINKKRFCKLTSFSRQVFLKLIQSGQIYGIEKAKW